MELVSVIVPLYNAEQYIEQCVESIRQQTYPALEIILVDDGSGDGSGPLCDALARADDRVRVIHQTHKGVSSARNAGLRAAKGEYIGFADIDDRCHTEMFSTLLRAMKDHGADAARSNYYQVRGGTQRPFLAAPAAQRAVTGKEAVRDMLCHTDRSGHGTVVWNTLLRARVVKEPEMISFDEHMSFGEDSDWLRRVLLRCGKVLLLPECLYFYNRDNQYSATGAYRYKDGLLSVEKTIAFLSENGFPEADLAVKQRQRARVLGLAEIEEYISHRCDTPTIRATPLIRNTFREERSPFGAMKITLILAMIKLRMPSGLVGWVWGLHK